MRFQLKWMVYATVVITVLTQVEALERLLRPLMYVAWAGTGGLALVMRGFKTGLSRFIKWFGFIYVIWLLICMGLSFAGTNHLNGRYLDAMAIPLFVTFVADVTRPLFRKQDIITLCKLYVIVAAVYALYVQLNYFGSYSVWLNSRMYVFMEKNSAAQIWCSAVLVVLYMIRPQSRREKLIWYGLAGLLLLVAGFSQCRTALLGMCAVMCVHVLLYSRHRLRWTLAVLGVVALLMILPFTRQFINQVLLLEKYAGADLNKMSSGRLGNYARALQKFQESPFIGQGMYYVDCSYLMVLTECGILGFVLIQSIWGFRVAINVGAWRAPCRLPLMLTVFYFVESLLEGLPPFGPGVSSFFFWLICGYLCAGGRGKRPVRRNVRLVRTGMTDMNQGEEII